MATHHLDDSQPHACWDNALPPRLHIRPGDTVVFETLEGFGGQLTPASTVDDLLRRDFSRAHALTGPVFVEGAEPGDALVVEVVHIEHKGWGCDWITASPDGMHLLAGEFHSYYLHHWRLDGEWAWFNERIRVPCEPFCGVMGVAPAEPGRIDTYPPRRNAGNIDVRHLTAGAIAYLPVFVPGALFSCGDGHAAQGDGEINGNAVECPLTVALRFDIRKGAAPAELWFDTPAGRPLTRADGGGYVVTTAHGPDLYQCAQQAVRYLLDYLVSAQGLSREEAYCLCGAAVDLRISAIVNAPNHLVSAYLPRSIFLDL